jgi:hypothetical protein
MAKAWKSVSVMIMLAAVLGLGAAIMPASKVEAAASLYEHFNTGAIGGQMVSGTLWYAQTFTAESSHAITSVKLKLSRTGNPGTVTVSIRAIDGSDHPIGEDLAVGHTDGNTLPVHNLNEWQEIAFTAPYSLNSGTKYAIVARAAYGDVSNYINWWYKLGGYTGGNCQRSENSGADTTWEIDGDLDMMFEVWGEAVSQAPSLFESNTAGEANHVMSFDNTYWHGQTFTAESNHSVTSVKLFVYRQSNPGTVTVSIRATNGNGRPIGEDLAVGHTDGNTLPVWDYEWREITFITPCTVTSGTKYAIIARVPYAATLTSYLRWLSTVDGSYSGGSEERDGNSGTTWFGPYDEDTDMRFEVWGIPPGNDEIGVWRGTTRYFYLDMNGNGIYNGTATERFGTFLSTTDPTDRPVAGDWDGDGSDEVGIWRGTTRYFYLDMDGDVHYDGSATERFGPFLGTTQANDVPVAGDWDCDGSDEVGIWRGATRYFYLDMDGDGIYDGSASERFGPFLSTTDTSDRPVAGDWDGDGTDEVGVWRGNTRYFYLDMNGNGIYNGTATERFGPFLSTTDSSDRPVAGDWDGDGSDEVGIWRGAKRYFYLDMGGECIYDGAATERFGPFLSSTDATDVPVAGNWDGL